MLLVLSIPRTLAHPLDESLVQDLVGQIAETRLGRFGRLSMKCEEILTLIVVV
jgi:hypothetical protein